MDEKCKLELLRNLLINAISMNMPERILMKISQKFDRCLIEYYRKTSNKNSSPDRQES